MTNKEFFINLARFFVEDNEVNFFMEIFECEKCGFIKHGVDLVSMNLKNGYVHCLKCDSYYKLEYAYREFKINNEPLFNLVRVDKKTVMENLLNCEDGKYTIIELE